MQRIFLGLAVVALLLLIVTLVVGMNGGDYNTPVHEYARMARQIRQRTEAQASPNELASLEERRQQLFAQVKQVQGETIPHMLLGILSALITLLVCSVSITYFVGTSRWFKEVVATYHLEPSYVDESARIKRRSFRWSATGALTIILVAGLGAASEPTLANAEHSQSFVIVHYIAGLISIALLALSFYLQATALAENGRLIERVMADVRRIRQERGLRVEA